MITGLDHTVLAVRDIEASRAIYEDLLDAAVQRDTAGKVSFQLGAQKINLQPADNLPPIAAMTAPGGANFCVLTEEAPEALAARLRKAGVPLLDGPVEKAGATGPILSVYLQDPDGNLVEVSRAL